jgi:hypothetical protein
LSRMPRRVARTDLRGPRCSNASGLPSGLPGRNGTGTSVRRCMPDGVRHPDGEAGRRSRAKGERRERRAGRSSCRRRPGRGSGPETGTSPRSLACLAPPADGHAGERRGRADRHCAAVNGCPKRPSPYPGITLSDKGGRGERAHCRRYGWHGELWRSLVRCPECRDLACCASASVPSRLAVVSGQVTSSGQGPDFSVLLPGRP